MGLRGRNAEPLDPEFKYFSPVDGLNREQFNFLGRFRWTEPASPWGSERATRAAWKKHREALLAQCEIGTRPIAFWVFDKKLDPPIWLYQEPENYAAILRHRCWRDEAEREYCKQELEAFKARERRAG